MLRSVRVLALDEDTREEQEKSVWSWFMGTFVPPNLSGLINQSRAGSSDSSDFSRRNNGGRVTTDVPSHNTLKTSSAPSAALLRCFWTNLNAMRIYEDYNIISNNPKCHGQGNACNNGVNPSCVLTTLSVNSRINCLRGNLGSGVICDLRVTDLRKTRPSSAGQKTRFSDDLWACKQVQAL